MAGEIRSADHGQVVEDDDLSVRIGEQPIDKMAADEARPAGDDHFLQALVHRRPVLPRVRRPSGYQTLRTR